MQKLILERNAEHMSPSEAINKYIYKKKPKQRIESNAKQNDNSIVDAIVLDNDNAATNQNGRAASNDKEEVVSANQNLPKNIRRMLE